MSAASPAEGPARIFAALGDPTRLSLLLALSRDGPRPIAALAGQRRMSRQAVTKHLRVLEEAGLVEGERAGRERVIRACPEPLGAARAYLDAVSAQWDDALARLQTHLETGGEAP